MRRLNNQVYLLGVLVTAVAASQTNGCNLHTKPLSEALTVQEVFQLTSFLPNVCGTDLKRVWETPLPPGVGAVHGLLVFDRLLVANLGDRIAAYDRELGTKKWETACAGAAAFLPAGECVFTLNMSNDGKPVPALCSPRDGRLEPMDFRLSSGRIRVLSVHLWHKELCAAFVSGPWMADGGGGGKMVSIVRAVIGRPEVLCRLDRASELCGLGYARNRRRWYVADRGDVAVVDADSCNAVRTGQIEVPGRIVSFTLDHSECPVIVYRGGDAALLTRIQKLEEERDALDGTQSRDGDSVQERIDEVGQQLRMGVRSYDEFGRTRWEVEIPSRSFFAEIPASSPLGILYVATSDVIAAVADGRVVWKAEMPGRRAEILLTVLGDNSVLVVSDGEFFRFSMQGKEIFRFGAGQMLTSRAFVDETGRVYLGGTKSIICFR